MISLVGVETDTQSPCTCLSPPNVSSGVSTEGQLQGLFVSTLSVTLTRVSA
jgi:hypothetical protein